MGIQIMKLVDSLNSGVLRTKTNVPHFLLNHKTKRRENWCKQRIGDLKQKLDCIKKTF